ncbi:MAG: Na+/H+ antiporter, partial [Chloroflexi bacterium]|nr:Na+/H+ antiporter [Chloroflexota bacterium]
MAVVEIILIALIAVVALATLAESLVIPYPILLVLGGIALGFVPGLPSVNFDPNTIFLIFIPPLVFSAAWRTSWRDFRANLRPIVRLAIELVAVTIVVVAVVAHAFIPGLTWPAAFVLGAIVSSTDAVAATAIAERLKLSQRIVTILEGESMANDPASLVAYRLAVMAVVSGTFSLEVASLQLLVAVVGGAAIGLAVALVADGVQHRLNNPPVEVTLTLLVPYTAFIIADLLATSSILAVATAGIVLGRHDPEVRSNETRLEADAFWDILVFLLNGLIFTILGLYLPQIVSGVANLPVMTLGIDAAIVIFTVVMVRIIWVFGETYLQSLIARRPREQLEFPPWKGAVVVGWAGMRGADSLVIALALPFTTAQRAPFPDRSVIIFLTFCVVVATLVVQGLSLPVLIRRLQLPGDVATEREVAKARAVAAQAALARLEALARSDGLPRELVELLRRRHQRRARVYGARASGTNDQAAEEEVATAQQLLRELVGAQRRAIVELRNRGEIGDAALRE